MNALVAIVSNTLRQLLGRRRTIGLLILSSVPALILFLVSLGEEGRELEEFFRQGMLTLILGVVIPIIALLLGAGAFGEERSGHTMPFLALRPIPREVIAAGKLIAAWIGSTLIGGVGAALAGVVMGVETGRWLEVPAILAATAITCLGFSAVFQVVGYITDRAVVIGLVYIVLWEGVITGAISAVATTSLWRIGMSAYAGIIAGSHWGAVAGLSSRVVDDLEDLLSGVQPGAWGAIAKVAVLAIISIAIVGYAMRDRDLVR